MQPSYADCCDGSSNGFRFACLDRFGGAEGARSAAVGRAPLRLQFRVDAIPETFKIARLRAEHADPDRHAVVYFDALQDDEAFFIATFDAQSVRLGDLNLEALLAAGTHHGVVNPVAVSLVCPFLRIVGIESRGRARGRGDGQEEQA